MPVGLDGFSEPLVTPARTAVLDRVADLVCRCRGDRVLVGVDGRSGAGKSTFGDELAGVLEQRDRVVVRSTTDLFHRPRAERMRRGPTSPEGYYEDSHQISTIIHELLVPFRNGASSVLVGAFDEPSDQPHPLRAPISREAILIFDGLFVHRPELRDHWDLSVMLHADRRRDEAWLQFLEADLPNEPTQRAAELDRRLALARWPRYRHGWSRYVEAIRDITPTVDVDNDDLASPLIRDR